MIIGIAGTILGIILGTGICYIQQTYQVISLPSDVYFISAMPIKMQLTDFIIITVVSLILTFISTIYPAYQASKLPPAETIRED